MAIVETNSYSDVFSSVAKRDTSTFPDTALRISYFPEWLLAVMAAEIFSFYGTA